MDHEPRRLRRGLQGSQRQRQPGCRNGEDGETEEEKKAMRAKFLESRNKM